MLDNKKKIYSPEPLPIPPRELNENNIRKYHDDLTNWLRRLTGALAQIATLETCADQPKDTLFLDGGLSIVTLTSPYFDVTAGPPPKLNLYTRSYPVYCGRICLPGSDLTLHIDLSC